MKKVFLKASKIQDMEKLSEYCTQNFGNKMTLRNKMTLFDFFEKANDYCPEKFSDMYSSSEVVLLKDSKANDQSAYSHIYDIMETLHYDNGEPLITEENNYFDQYNRYEELYGYFDYMEIYDFVTDGNNLYIRVDMSLKELEEKLRDEYDGVSYEHDFPER